MDLTLRCTAGPLLGETIQIDAELVLGRESREPGSLGGDRRLSRRHARLFLDEAGRPCVEDLGSTNGTWLNGERLTEIAMLRGGDELRVGQTTFEVDLPDRPEPTELDSAAVGAARTVQETPPRLRVAAGALQGHEIPINDELLIGRSYGEPGALGGDRLLSRRHARIARGPGGVFFLEDTGSTNGTTVNRQRLRGSHPLRDGDEILVGSTTLEPVGMPGAPLTEELEDAREPEPGAPLPGARGQTPESFAPRGAAGARLSSRLVLGFFVSVFVAAIGLALGAVRLSAPPVSRACPRGFICHGPSTARPLRVLRTYVGSLGWRVEYDPQMAAIASADTTIPNQVIIEESGSLDRAVGLPRGTKLVGVVIRAYPSSQISAQPAMRALAGSLDSNLVGTGNAPPSDQMFASPTLGFHPAFGEVLEGNVRTPQGPGALFKLAVMAAASGSVTIAAGVIYEVRPGSSQQSNPNTVWDQFGDQVLQTVRFPSDGAS